jgi:ribosomal protein S18 acetylase RimI-like enzyme
MNEVAVRPAEPREVPVIRDIAERAWNAVYGDVLDPATVDAALTAWYTGGALLDAIRAVETAFFVAERAGEVAGYVTGNVLADPALGEVGAIYVDPDHWRCGIGSRLLTRLEDHGRREGWDAVQIRVLTENRGACSFYEARGYEAVRAGVVDLFGEDAPERFYRKQL